LGCACICWCWNIFAQTCLFFFFSFSFFLPFSAFFTQRFHIVVAIFNLFNLFFGSETFCAPNNLENNQPELPLQNLELSKTHPKETYTAQSVTLSTEQRWKASQTSSQSQATGSRQTFNRRLRTCPLTNGSGSSLSQEHVRYLLTPPPATPQHSLTICVIRHAPPAIPDKTRR
jgi:hypothetical protein